MKTNKEALAAWLKELESLLAPLMPRQTPYPDIILEPDFRRMVIPSPSSAIVDTAIASIGNYALHQELTERARRLERDLTDFDCNKRRFREECNDGRVAAKRRANGTLSNAPEALKLLRRNLQGDIARLKELINGAGEAQQPPVKAELDGEQAEQLKVAAARSLKELSDKSMGGRKGAAVAKSERGEDKKRKAILDDAKKLLSEWDARYPDRHKPPRDEQHSNAAAFRMVANRHKGADGKPIMSADTIGRTLRREKAKDERRGKYDRTGQRRGKYKPRT